MTTRTWIRPLLALALAVLVGCQSASTPQRRRGGRPQGATAVQGIVGAADYHKVEFERVDPGDPTNVVTADLSTMPVIGFAGQYALGGDRIEFGLDGGLLFSWDSDKATAFSTGSGSAVIIIDRSLLLVDLFMGPYASTIIGDRVRLYASAGPNLMWGDADYSDELISDSEMAFGVGGYARGGVEFRLADRSFLGFGMRFVSTELEFGGAIGDVDVEGWQGFVTFTQGF